jgi:hypothetical protein
MRRHFHKMHGLGNDFVIIDARQEPFEVIVAPARSLTAAPASARPANRPRTKHKRRPQDAHLE